MGHCKYCAQKEKLDKFGYCIKYSCFIRAGKDKILYRLKSEASNIWLIPKNAYGQVGTVVTNYYSKRTKFANEVMQKAEKEFGFVPSEILNKIPEKNRKKWDEKIRW